MIITGLNRYIPEKTVEIRKAAIKRRIQAKYGFASDEDVDDIYDIATGQYVNPEVVTTLKKPAAPLEVPAPPLPDYLAYRQPKKTYPRFQILAVCAPLVVALVAAAYISFN